MESPPRQSMDWMMTTRINCCFFVSKDYEMIKGTNHFGQENTKIKWVIKNAAVFYCFVLTHSCANVANHVCVKIRCEMFVSMLKQRR